MDLVIIGSGAAGLSAALAARKAGLNVSVLEKTDLFGGTTAVSEGMVWAPLSAAARAAGVEDTAEAAVAYLMGTSHGRGSRERIAAYVDHAPRMLDFLETHTLARFRLNRSSMDYYPEAEGATRGARALNPGIFDARQLDRALFARLRPPLPTMMLLGGMSVASADLADYTSALRSPGALWRVAGHASRYAADRLAGWPRGTRLANGNGLAAALLHALRREGVTLRSGVHVRRLLREGGAVTGVEFVVDGHDERIEARCGVILATGSFSHSASLTAQWYPHVKGGLAHTTVAPAGADGDGLVLAQEVGAALDGDLSAPALWTPSSSVPMPDGSRSPWPHFGDRAKPGVIAVNHQARRFANEAVTYRDFVEAMLAQRGNQPDAGAFLIFDHEALRTYGMGPIGPRPVPLGRFLASGYLRRAPDIAALAREIGLDPDALATTVARYNMHAAMGQDPDFGKGTSAYDRGNGDAGNRPAPNLRPLLRGPFYAIAIQPGDLGTFVGLRTDAQTRVLDDAGAPIPGLFAAGNTAATLTGGNYPAAGLTIGAALTFGHIAGLRAAGVVG